jgi:hypothetical protein
MGLLVDGKWTDRWYDTRITGGRFVRQESRFRNWITLDGSPGPTGEGGFKAEPGRYHLYVSLACPWAHRTLIFRVLKGLENAISLLEDVAEVAVIGVPDEQWGERVHAIIVPKRGTNLTAERVLEHCREQIASYKCPRSVDFQTAPLPLSGVGKVLKRELREPYWKGFTKAVN